MRLDHLRKYRTWRERAAQRRPLRSALWIRVAGSLGLLLVAALQLLRSTARYSALPIAVLALSLLVWNSVQLRRHVESARTVEIRRWVVAAWGLGGGALGLWFWWRLSSPDPLVSRLPVGIGVAASLAVFGAMIGWMREETRHEPGWRLDGRIGASRPDRGPS